MTELLEAILPIYCAANLMFEFFLSQDNGQEAKVTLGALLGIIVGVVHMFLPMQDFNKLICYVKEAEPNTKNYDAARAEFDDDYDRQNPITSKQARIDFAEE
jgi:hypothetical protein